MNALRTIIVITLLLTLTAVAASAQDTLTTTKKQPKGLLKQIEKIKQRIDEPFDTVRDTKYWRRALAHGKLDLHDKTIEYPKFLDFCIEVYRWGDHAFNYYDSTYVTGTGKNWKVMLKSNNWLDSYSGQLTSDHIRMQMNSDLTCNFGAQISFMALSLSYMVNLRDPLAGRQVKNTRWEFSFTSSRLALEAYFTKNNQNSVHLHRLGSWHGSKDFNGLTRESYGAYAYYFFNHKRYAQAAAYCFSKYQRRSAGSFLAGLHLSRQDITIDFSVLPTSFLRAKVPQDLRLCRFRYRDFCALIGYGYNWVFAKNWLLNITGIPSVGYRHSFANSVEGEKGLLSTNIRGKAALVYNRGSWFYGLHIISDGHWYHSRQHSLFNSCHDFNFTAGYRF